MVDRRCLLLCLASLAVLTACPSPVTPRSTRSTAPQPPGVSTSPSTLPPPVVAPPVVGPPVMPPAVVPGGGLISDQGAGIIGKVKGPASIISHNGGNLISDRGGSLISDRGGSLIGNNAGGYRLQSVSEVPFVGITVELQRPDGTPVLDAAGQRITAVTGADGSYRLAYTGGNQHVIVAAKLPSNLGAMLAFSPRGLLTAATTIDVDLASTLTMGYILDRYVRNQPDPAAVLERLPAELEAETRSKVAAATALVTAAPTDLTASAVVDLVERLRAADKTVDSQLVTVKQVLLAGLSDQGAGQPADSLETDAIDVAINPAGEILFASSSALRVWKKDKNGTLIPMVGTGMLPADQNPAPTAPAEGDGGPATLAPINPVSMMYAPDGQLLIADFYSKRIRQVSPSGIISTRVAHADWKELRDFVLEPDGSLVVATHSAIWRAPPGGQPVLIAGDVRLYDAQKWPLSVASGFGGKPADARFTQLNAIARDPRNGDLYVFDSLGSVSRITKDLIERVAGTGTIGFSGDGGPAASAQLGAFGGLTVRPDGSLVIADTFNHRLREIVDGTITTIAGTGEANFRGDGGPAMSAGTISPLSLVRAPDGTLYFVDSGRVRQLAQGVLRSVVGGMRGHDTARPASDVALFGPGYLTYDAASDSMWVSDSRHIWHWNLLSNTMVSIFGAGPDGASMSNGAAARATGLILPKAIIPQGDDSYTVLASDPASYAGHVLQVKNGLMTSIAGGALVAGQAEKNIPAVGATLTAAEASLIELDGWYYYTLSPIGRIRRFQLGGNIEAYAGNGTEKTDGALAKNFDFGVLTAMAVGPDGQIYVGDWGAIYRIDPTTTAVTRVAGVGKGSTGDGGPALDAQTSTVGGFAWDSAGHLYFSEATKGVVRRIRKDTGIIERVAGSGTSVLSGQTIDTGLASPTGLAFDKNGALYIADQRHGQIKVVTKAQLGL